MNVETAPWWTVRKWRAVVAIGLTYITTVLAQTGSFVLLPDIADEFDITLRVVGWAVIIHALVISALLLPLGRLADAFGRRRALTLGLVLFTVGNAATAFAPSFGLLIGARVVMSIGDAMTQAVGTAALVAAFPPEERGLAIGAQTTTVGVGAAAGPLLTGWALGFVDWRTLFVVIAVMAALAAVVGWTFLDGDADQADDKRLDVVGAVLSALVIVSLTLGLSDPFDAGIGSPISLGLLLVATLALVAFVRWELSRERPLLDVRLFTIRTFHTAAAIRVLSFAAGTTWFLLLPIYLLSVRDVATTTAGAVIACTAVGMSIGAQIGGRVYDRFGARRPATFGLAAQAILLLWISSVGLDTPIGLLAAVMFCAGIAQSLWNVPNNSALMGSPPPDALGVVGALSNINRTLGNVIGQAFAAALITAVMRSDGVNVPLSEIETTPGAVASFLDGWQWTFLGAAMVTVVAGLVALRLPPRHDSHNGG